MRRSLSIALTLVLAGCSHAERVETSTSSSIVLAPGEARVLVASPDDDVVSEIDATTLEETQRIDVAGEPTELVWAGDHLVVTLGSRSAIAVVDTSRAVSFVDVPCGATRSAVVVDDDVYVTCPFDDRVVRVDLGARVVSAIVHVPGGPTSIARGGDVIAVGAARTGALHFLSLALLTPLRAEAVVELDGIEHASAALESTQGFAATHVEAIAPDALGRFATSFTRVDHDSDRSRPPEQGGYGSVVDGAPRIEPRLFGPCGARYARFDGGPRASSGPSALAWQGDRLWIAHQYTDDVTVLRCASPDVEATPIEVLDEAARANGEADWIGSFSVGRAPRGIVLSADGERAWIDLAFDHAVALVSLSDVSTRQPRTVRRRALGPTRWSETALRGRSAFHDATDTHLTPSGIVTCATCHPGGQEDGVTWFLSTSGVPRKLRRTPAAWGARSSLAPYHWDGAFTDAALLSRTTIHELMGGDALLVDLDAIAAYLAEIPPPPARTPTETEASQIAAGREVFESSGCAECHAGAMLSDGASHTVLAPSLDLDAELEGVDTPSLVGVRTRAPFLHDGRAESLRDVLVAHNRDDHHGRTTSLAVSELESLIAYLESL